MLTDDPFNAGQLTGRDDRYVQGVGGCVYFCVYIGVYAAGGNDRKTRHRSAGGVTPGCYRGCPVFSARELSSTLECDSAESWMPARTGVGRALHNGGPCVKATFKPKMGRTRRTCFWILSAIDPPFGVTPIYRVRPINWRPCDQ